jgi:hypothetical protein
MGFVAYPPLVTAVSNASGIGVLGNAIEPPPSTQQLIRMIAAGTPHLFGVDLLHDKTAFGPATTDEHVEICASERVKLVIFHSNVPPVHWVDRLHAVGCRVWMQAASVEQAEEAARTGVDAIVAQGRQAGGHNKSVVRTIPLLRQVIRAVKPMMVLASGGIATGRDVAEALVNGADGVWVGTRMVASVEAYAHDEYKRRLLSAHGPQATTITAAFGPEYSQRRAERTEVRLITGDSQRPASDVDSRASWRYVVSSNYVSRSRQARRFAAWMRAQQSEERRRTTESRYSAYSRIAACRWTACSITSTPRSSHAPMVISRAAPLWRSIQTAPCFGPSPSIGPRAASGSDARSRTRRWPWRSRSMCRTSIS